VIPLNRLPCPRRSRPNARPIGLAYPARRPADRRGAGRWCDGLRL